MEQEERQTVEVFAKEFNELLKTAKLTQREFAQKIGVSFNTVNGWATGKVQPKLFQLKKIIEYFMCNPNIQHFNPLQLFIPKHLLNNQDCSVLEKTIDSLKVDCNSLKQANEEIELLKKENTKFKKENERLKETNEKHSKQLWQYKDKLESREYYNEERHKLVKREREYLKKGLKQNCKIKYWYPQSIANEILKDPRISKVVDKLCNLTDKQENEKLSVIYHKIAKIVRDTIEEKVFQYIDKAIDELIKV